MKENLRNLLEQALKDAGLSHSMSRRLPKQIWEAVVGAEIAARAQPTVLANFVLHVLVQDHRWRDQLDAMRTELMSRLNARLGKPLIREIRFGLAHAGALPDRVARALQTPGRQFIDRARDQAGRGLAAIREQDPAHLHCASKLGPDLQDAFLRAGLAAHRASQGSFA